MVRLSVFILLSLTGVYALSLEKAKKLESDSQSKNVISQIFKEFELKSSLKVQYEDKIVENGMDVPTELFGKMPLVSFELGSPEKRYTLIMFDADNRLYHWVVKDIHGVGNDGTSSYTETPFEPIIPNHRYVFALLEQPLNGQSVQLSRYFDWIQIAENNLELNSAIYMNYKQRHTKRDASISVPAQNSLFGKISENLMDMLEQFGIRVATKNSNQDILDNSQAFVSSFNSIRSMNENHNSHFLPAPTLGLQLGKVNTNKNKNNAAEIMENVINRAFLELQSQMSVNNIPTPTLQLRKKESPDPMVAVESMFNRAILNMEGHKSTNGAQQTSLPKKDPAKAMEKMIDIAFREIQSQVAFDKLLKPTPIPLGQENPVEIFEDMINHVFKDIEYRTSASQGQPGPTLIKSELGPTPSLEPSTKKPEPWLFDGLHNMMGTIADFRKMLSNKLKDNALESESSEPEDSNS